MSTSPPNSSPPTSVRGTAAPYTGLSLSGTGLVGFSSAAAVPAPRPADLDAARSNLFRPALSASPPAVVVAPKKADTMSAVEDIQPQWKPRETEMILKPEPTRDPAIPYTGHAPAALLPQPSKAALVARAASPLKPRTQRLPNAEALADFCLPSVLDLQVSLESMSVGALEGRHFILQQELQRVESELLKRKAVEVRNATLWDSHGGTRHPASSSPSTALVPTENSPSPPRYEPPPPPRITNSRVVDEVSRTPIRNQAAGSSLANELRGIAMRAVTPNRTRGAHNGAVQVPRHHPASGPPSPLRSQSDVASFLGVTTPQHHRPPSSAATLAVDANWTSGAAKLTDTNPTRSVPNVWSARQATAASALSAMPSSASLETDYMYPAHHNLLLDELMAMRMKRLGHIA